jgi:Zn-dependent protease with chaperone function
MWTSASVSRSMDVADVVWPGFYYDGRTAHRESVRVGIAGEHLRITRSDGAIVEWPIRALRQSQGAHGDRLRLEFGADPVESLVIEGPGLAEAISVLVPSANPGLTPARRPWRLIAGLVVLIVGAGAAYLWGAPVFARWLAPRVPVAWESELGQAVAARMLRSDSLCADSAAVGSVRAVLDRLLAAAPASPYTFRLYVVRDTTINAFAAPGGVIVINSGLLSAAHRPEELAMVLAHEAQHVLQQHSTRAAIREIPLRLALASLGDGGLGSAATVGGTLGVLRYRREDERDADLEGMRMLQRADVDGIAAARFMRTLEQRAKNVPRLAAYLSSHPISANRALALERMAREPSHETRPLMGEAEWARVRAGCGS